MEEEGRKKNRAQGEIALTIATLERLVKMKEHGANFAMQSGED